ncbi:Ankyrin Repeat [Orbilia oligospora]|uniref:Ankyrin Repeat n=1 Tax=Orbilia oligospora TaxID=2813651 RepID=A0A7C8J459_ORBOL|nr:Ankyrin Repeat [Orbilia oligospora]
MMEAGTTGNRRKLTADDYTIAIIYVKPIEMGAITAMVDEFHQPVELHINEKNEYTLGRIGSHNIAIVGPAKGKQGKVAITGVAARISYMFRNIKVGLLVGIGGGIPRPDADKDVRLGDVVVGAPEYGDAIVQYDLGKQYTDRVENSRSLNKPPDILLRVVDSVNDEYRRAKLEDDFFRSHLKRFEQFPRIEEDYKRPKAADRLFNPLFEHDGSSCSEHHTYYEVKRKPRNPRLGDVKIHYGTILSGGDFDGRTCTGLSSRSATWPTTANSSTTNNKNTTSQPLWGGDFFDSPLFTPPPSTGSQTPARALWGGDFFDGPQFTPPTSPGGTGVRKTYTY